MTENDKADFAALVTSVHAFYRQDVSQFALGVWWEACKPFDMAAVHDAFNRHCINPDSGQFMPKPADVVRMLQGSSKDGALVAWSKFDRAVRQVGTYQSVCFDDPIIHAAVQDMGGWVHLGSKEEKEWPFLRNEFESRYRGYKLRGGPNEYPKVLIGIAEAQNKQNGFKAPPPVLIGDETRAKQVMLRGSDKPAIGFHRLDVGEIAWLAAPQRKIA